ncbi:pyruvate, phosphate dikinase/phosphoenolpyruvate synthase regulator [Acetobacter musti]|mgnify:CR=1 FL=1|uniref:Putative pyruvate, phosphate dikinase regulatory protein n=1 Tax=Acetobacter musti TaxID=864732 RepID=A0ABX0JP43_9PROT|nr:pyruvate, water dikinase regulatory protein [Acetobacter musti]NHN85181.1 pyruvate, phosphate dikinase/phosphoenolpyruvate synthase regulator [Acetobacter musti]
MTTKPGIILHLVSGGIGQTLDSLARACVPHFPENEFEVRHWNLVRTRTQLRRVMAGIAAERGPVLSSLTDHELQKDLEDGCARVGVQLLDVMNSTLALLERVTGTQPSGHAGGQYVMDENYFRRIDAMHYVIEHDDGQQTRELREADVILVGVSRASKTPTCFYLANRGIKAANVPLVPDTPLPPELFEARVPVIGLTIDPDALVEIRRTRLSSMVAVRPGDKSALHETSYVDPEEVRVELLWARRLCARHGWPVVDVTRRSIEETSAAILEILEHPGPTRLPG